MEKKENCQPFAELKVQELDQISGGNWLREIWIGIVYGKSKFIDK
ncbi:ComC/BlpC family leader-containing pheromone/bacteriocin [Streptococcus pacificus]|uniref:ComC/BlpC family leader-containing pheromone/bacteriocin n=1 Tax=Streptococcus pacificus TaxID=2740577 RepID=A0ABS0ZJ89_9STRE|nr:ComC/BlpC family leader-containing pheromone/bacteriocin [Streptococcus pacificus]MBJ8326065.1 ComC/BlpC family leader-containing pheromone/bacteriocin [Streptococcus pacificus]